MDTAGYDGRGHRRKQSDHGQAADAAQLVEQRYRQQTSQRRTQQIERVEGGYALRAGAKNGGRHEPACVKRRGTREKVDDEERDPSD